MDSFLKFAQDKERPRILALDLDGTVLSYKGFEGKDEFGLPLRGIIEELLALRDNGWQIVVWTCRPDTPALRQHLQTHDVPFDHVNDHPWNGPDNPRKIHADVYYDDKGLQADGNPSGLAEAVMAHKPWWQEPWL